MRRRRGLPSPRQVAQSAVVEPSQGGHQSLVLPQLPAPSVKFKEAERRTLASAALKAPLCLPSVSPRQAQLSSARLQPPHNARTSGLKRPGRPQRLPVSLSPRGQQDDTSKARFVPRLAPEVASPTLPRQELTTAPLSTDSGPRPAESGVSHTSAVARLQTKEGPLVDQPTVLPPHPRKRFPLRPTRRLASRRPNLAPIPEGKEPVGVGCVTEDNLLRFPSS